MDKPISGCKGVKKVKKSYYRSWTIIFNGIGCHLEFTDVECYILHVLTHSHCQVEAKSRLPAGDGNW